MKQPVLKSVVLFHTPKPSVERELLSALRLWVVDHIKDGPLHLARYGDHVSLRVPASAVPSLRRFLARSKKVREAPGSLVRKVQVQPYKETEYVIKGSAAATHVWATIPIDKIDRGSWLHFEHILRNLAGYGYWDEVVFGSAAQGMAARQVVNGTLQQARK